MKLITAEGRELSLTKSAARKGAMPKRGTPVELVVDGNPVIAIVTTNLAWCGDPALALEYIWIPVGDGALYVTLGYGEKAASWSGAEVKLAEGTGPKVPNRVTATAERGLVEATREAKFRATWEAKYGKKSA